MTGKEQMEAAVRSFVEPYSNMFWLSPEQESSAAVDLLDDLITGLYSKDKATRERAYLATQMILIIGLKVCWTHYMPKATTLR